MVHCNLALGEWEAVSGNKAVKLVSIKIVYEAILKMGVTIIFQGE